MVPDGRATVLNALAAAAGEVPERAGEEHGGYEVLVTSCVVDPVVVVKIRP
jgi:hypothetical protein